MLIFHFMIISSFLLTALSGFYGFLLLPLPALGSLSLWQGAQPLLLSSAGPTCPGISLALWQGAQPLWLSSAGPTCRGVSVPLTGGTTLMALFCWPYLPWDLAGPLTGGTTLLSPQRRNWSRDWTEQPKTWVFSLDRLGSLFLVVVVIVFLICLCQVSCSLSSWVL